MGITASGWLDWAERVPGPVEKQYSQANTIERYLPHSMVGTLNGWYSRLFDMSRNPDGRFTDNAAASVHGSILLNGHVIQHYPFFSSCWASGNAIANTTGVAFENESMYTNGSPDESIPLTELQMLSNVRIINELSIWRGWKPKRPVGLAPATLLEHNEAVRLWGGGGTVCPSDRVEWNKILYLLNMEEEMQYPLAFVKLPNQETFLINFAANTATYVASPAAINDARALNQAPPGPTPTVGEEYLKLFQVIGRP